ncbi:MAG: dihydropteroate synthase [Firmicutes bacterium]|jgi:dihydropteroate synthase|nr:dihydropteroate synthase [Bacillota bacterium]
MDKIDKEQACRSDRCKKQSKVRRNDARVAMLPCKKDVDSELLRMGVSQAGIDIMSPKGVFRTVALRDVPIKAALIIKQEMLAKGGEAALPYSAAGLSMESCDLLLMGTLRQYERVVATLLLQPFGLPAIAKQIECALANYDKGPESMSFGGRTFLCGERTYIMGILNVTPDSFSDGGEHDTADSAFRHAMAMLEAGADIIDIGGESTRPGADPLPVDEELQRVLPIVKRLASQTDAVISIDTYKAEVAERCLDFGAHIINDVSALRGDGDMASVISRYNAPVVLMHSKGRPTHMQADPTYECVVREVYDFLAERMAYACERGISPCNIILDPGIGFGKTPQHNLEIMRRLAEFKSLGRPILMGTSRKSTIGKVLRKPVGDRVWGTAATVAMAIAAGADIVRVHDVAEMAMVARMTDAIIRGWRGEEEGHGS